MSKINISRQKSVIKFEFELQITRTRTYDGNIKERSTEYFESSEERNDMPEEIQKAIDDFVGNRIINTVCSSIRTDKDALKELGKRFKNVKERQEVIDSIPESIQVQKTKLVKSVKEAEKLMDEKIPTPARGTLHDLKKVTKILDKSANESANESTNESDNESQPPLTLSPLSRQVGSTIIPYKIVDQKMIYKSLFDALKGCYRFNKNESLRIPLMYCYTKATKNNLFNFIKITDNDCLSLFNNTNLFKLSKEKYESLLVVINDFINEYDQYADELATQITQVLNMETRHSQVIDKYIVFVEFNHRSKEMSLICEHDFTFKGFGGASITSGE